MKRASVLFVFSFLVCLLASVSVVQAGGFALYEWGNRALGMGTANYATGNDPSVVAYNPAQMTRPEGTQAYAGVTAISPSSDVIVDGVESHTKSQVFGVPHGYITHQISDDWFLGFGAYTRFGLGTKYDEFWDAATLLKSALLETVSFNPVAAYKVNDDLSLAFGIELMKGTFEVRRDHPAAGNQTILVNAAGTSFAGNLGLLYDITDDLSFGFTYRTPVHFEGTGKGSISGLGALPDSDVTMTADFPASYTAGLGYSPIDDLKIEFDIVYTQWEQFDRIEFDFTGGVLPDNNEDFNYKSTWRFQIGAEYLVTEAVALRAGFVYDQTPTRHEYASMMLPANDRRMFTLGAGYAWDNWKLDLAGMYILTKERHALTMYNSAGTPFRVDFENGSTWGLGTSIGYTF